MPVSWGTQQSPPATTSGFDIEQYCRFFALRGNDLNFARKAGLWKATVLDEWGVVAESGECEMLFEALNECYLIVRGFAPASLRPRQE